MWTIAFLTGTPGGDVATHLSEDYLSVYVPTTPNPTGGYFVLVEKPARRRRRAVAQAQIALHRLAPQVENAMLEARALGEVVVVDLERRRRRCVEDFHLVHKHLDLAGRQLGIHRARRARAHFAGDLEHELAAHPLGDAERLLALGIEHHLGETFAIAQVDEDHSAMVAPAMRPAAQRHGLADQACAQRSTVMASHFCGGTTPMEMMYFRAWSTLMSSSTTSLRATMTK